MEHRHKHAVGGAHRQQVHQYRLERQQHRAQEDQEDDIGEAEYEQDDLPHRAGDLRNQLRAEQKQDYHHDDQQLGEAQIAEHVSS